MVAETDEEQVEQIKKWLEENGLSLVLTIVIAVGGTFGYRAWENSVQTTGESASALYENLSTAVGGNIMGAPSEELLQTGKTLAQQLKDDYGDSTYAVFGSLQMAKAYVDQGALGAAEQELKWALAAGAPNELEIVTRMRLAKVLAEQDKFNEAISVLDKPLELAAFKSAWEETRGDVYYAKGDMESARQSYQMAVNALGEEDQRPYLSMKLDDLTTVPADDESGAE